MKIIEALKKIKDLKRKADDLKEKIGKYCADLDCDTPTYPDQRREVEKWLQSHSDIIKEICHLRTAISRTNLMTDVAIELGGKYVTKCIAEWIHRRKDLAKEEEQAWRKLNDKGLGEEYRRRFTEKSPEVVIKRRLYFDASQRDNMVELYRSEPSIIDATLEITNAVTDLIEK